MSFKLTITHYYYWVKLFVIFILDHLFIKIVVFTMTAGKLLRVDVIKKQVTIAVLLYCLLLPPFLPVGLNNLL